MLSDVDIAKLQSSISSHGEALSNQVAEHHPCRATHSTDRTPLIMNMLNHCNVIQSDYS